MKRFESVLIIDDDGTSSYLTKRLLLYTMDITSHVFIACNGAEGLKFIEQLPEEISAPPEIIFLDINMPVCDGFEFMQAFNKLNEVQKHNVNIIVLTTSTNPHDVDRMTALGVKFYIKKPLDKEKLLEILGKIN